MVILEDILGSKVNIAILRFLIAVHGGLSGNEIANRLGLRQSSARQALERLVRTGIVTRTDIGRSAAYELDHELAFPSAVLMPLFEAELQQRSDVIDELAACCRKLAPKPAAMVLFGSLARGERSFRDADVLCVVPRAADRAAARDAIVQAFDSLQRRYKLYVNAVVVTPAQLTSSKLASLKKEVQRDGILLYGEIPAALPGVRVR